MRRALAALLVLTGSAASAETSLPDPLKAGWNGQQVCELLSENDRLRTLRCTFPPGGGHDRHFHAAHWGYILTDATMRITDRKSTAVRQLKAGSTWWSDGLAWHEAVNIGSTTAVYLIVEPK